MRLTSFFRSTHPVAPEPLNPATTDTTMTAATPSLHSLSHAPKAGTAQGAAKSRQGMLASARKSLATLRKQLPSMCMGAPATKIAQSQPALAAPAPNAARRGENQRPPVPQAGVDARWQAPDAMPPPRSRAPTRTAAPPQAATAVRTTRGRTLSATSGRPRGTAATALSKLSQARSGVAAAAANAPLAAGTGCVPEAATPAPPSPSRPLRPVRNMNLELAALNEQCHHISRRLYKERRAPSPEERSVFEMRAALIAVRDRQLDGMLEVLSPLETIAAPKTTSSPLAMVQRNVMQSNRHALLEVRRKKLDMTRIARYYTRAQRRLESLKESDAPPDKIQRLERMMQGYANVLALQDMVKRTDDQLHRMGAPRLMDSIPTTAQERALAEQNERDAHQEAIDNGYY
ncbi:type III secretion system effector protein XopR [Xanthomonas euvesicatoria]|uniref:type III secretion system effector protein XopR n=1 Tax=Xanthomonas citri TaxID=346 RepID=UPI0026B3C7CC|nr:type III secretion system effector protein XopR [Xanthomonas axonopodis]MEE5090745.1 type III secretion system effector protein XopR [Xanthomonas euvesicatoria]